MSTEDDSSALPTPPLAVLSLDQDTDQAGASIPIAVIPIPMAVIPIPTTRFCRTCGTPLQGDATGCLHCASKAARISSPSLTDAGESRAMKSSLCLYFSLLLACAIALGLSRSMGGVGLEIAVCIALTVITVGWCLFSAPSVLPLLAKVPHPGWFGLALLLSVPTYLIAIGVITWLSNVLHAPADSMSKPFLDAGYGWFMVILFSCIQPAMVEELAFRGVIFSGLTKTLSSTETIVVSALMFMILHLSPARFPHTLALGLGAGFLRQRTKSLYPCMLMHFSHNFLCIAGEWLWR